MASKVRLPFFTKNVDVLFDLIHDFYRLEILKDNKTKSELRKTYNCPIRDFVYWHEKEEMNSTFLSTNCWNKPGYYEARPETTDEIKETYMQFSKSIDLFLKLILKKQYDKNVSVNFEYERTQYDPSRSAYVKIAVCKPNIDMKQFYLIRDMLSCNFTKEQLIQKYGETLYQFIVGDVAESSLAQLRAMDDEISAVIKQRDNEIQTANQVCYQKKTNYDASQTTARTQIINDAHHKIKEIREMIAMSKSEFANVAEN